MTECPAFRAASSIAAQPPRTIRSARETRFPPSDRLNACCTRSTQALLIYTITALHVALVGLGMLYLAVMGFRAVGGQLTGRSAEGVSAAVLYWFVTVGLYAAVWYAITITK